MNRFNDTRWLLYSDFRLALDKHKYMFDSVRTYADSDRVSPTTRELGNRIVKNCLRETLILEYRIVLTSKKFNSTWITLLASIDFEIEKIFIKNVVSFNGAYCNLSKIYRNHIDKTICYESPDADGEHIMNYIISTMIAQEEDVQKAHERIAVKNKLTKHEKEIIKQYHFHYGY